jgi:hypothetical protein
MYFGGKWLPQSLLYLFKKREDRDLGIWRAGVQLSECSLFSDCLKGQNNLSGDLWHVVFLDLLVIWD